MTFFVALKIFGVKHRGITHTFLGFCVIISTVYIFSVNYGEDEAKYIIPLSVGFGYFLHLVGDMMTKGGIPRFFYPVSDIKAVLLPRWLRFYTGSLQEGILFFALALFDGFMLYNIFLERS